MCARQKSRKKNTAGSDRKADGRSASDRRDGSDGNDGRDGADGSDAPLAAMDSLPARATPSVRPLRQHLPTLEVVAARHPLGRGACLCRARCRIRRPPQAPRSRTRRRTQSACVPERSRRHSPNAAWRQSCAQRSGQFCNSGLGAVHGDSSGVGREERCSCAESTRGRRCAGASAAPSRRCPTPRVHR